MQKYSTFWLLLIIFTFQGWVSKAQISQGGIPQSFAQDYLSAGFQHIDLSVPDVNQLTREDSLDGKNGRPLRVGVPIPVNITINNAGTWARLPGGGRIWRLELKAKGALAMNINFSSFFLPEGTKLFIYDPPGTQVLGAFTSANNSKDSLFATALINGDQLVLEYFEPSGTTLIPLLEISEISYVYRDSQGNARTFARLSDHC